MPGTATLVGGSLGFAMQMYINALRKLPLLRSASPPLARRPSRIPRAPLAPRKFLTRAPIRPFRVCSPPRARRAASRSSARDAFVRATPGPRRPARRLADLARRAAPLTPRPAPHIIVSCLLFPQHNAQTLGSTSSGRARASRRRTGTWSGRRNFARRWTRSTRRGKRRTRGSWSPSSRASEARAASERVAGGGDGDGTKGGDVQRNLPARRRGVEPTRGGLSEARGCESGAEASARRRAV